MHSETWILDLLLFSFQLFTGILINHNLSSLLLNHNLVINDPNFSWNSGSTAIMFCTVYSFSIFVINHFTFVDGA